VNRQVGVLGTFTLYMDVCDRSVGIATGYGLDDRGSNLCRGKIFLFSTASRPALGHTQPPIQWLPEVIFPGDKAAGP
jgi:hypothetical protein